MWSVGANSESGNIRWEASGPCCPSERVNNLKHFATLLWNLRLFMSGTFSVYTEESTMRRVMVSGHFKIHYNSNMSTLPSGTLYRGECLPSSADLRKASELLAKVFLFILFFFDCGLTSR